MAVYQDKNNKTKNGNSWYFRTYYKSISGERKQFNSKKYATKKEAIDQERVFLLTLTDKLQNKDMTFNDLINDYLLFQKDKVKVSSYGNYNKLIKLLNEFLNLKVDSITIQKYNNWKNEINKSSYTTTYKNNVYKFFRAVLHYGEKYHDLDFKSLLNKMTGFSNPNELKKEMLFWTYDEFKQFISVVDDFKYKVYFEMLYYCGLRKEEANALNWHDILFDTHNVLISKSLSTKIKGERYVILPPKTKNSRRLLPLPKVLENDLKILYKEYSKYSNFDKQWFVFGGIFPLSDTAITEKKNKYCKIAGVKEIRIHDFRHSTASLLISNGASITLVAKYLGHSNIATTLNTYTHMFKNELDDIIDVINNL